MRYSILATALIASVYASPLVVRDVEVFTEYAYVTDVVTVTATAGAPEQSVAAVPVSYTKHWKPKPHKAPATTQAPPPPKTYQAPPAPKPTTVAQAKPKPKPKPSPSPSVQAAAAPAYSGGKPSFSDIVVMHHNEHRKNHSAPALTWDQGLADTAQKIGESCQYAHNVVMDGGQYGQNIAAGAPADNISSIITDKFYNAELPFFDPFYNQDTPSDMSDETFDKFGHYTQIVWKGTHKVGCAVVDCTGKGNGPNGLGQVADNVPPYFTVCNYGPPGNYLGQFKDNVHKPEGKPTIDWSWGL